MLDRRAFELGADVIEQCLPVLALDAVEFHLDQFVGGQGAMDFLEHGLGEAILADADHRVQVVRGGTQVAPLERSEFDHGGILPVTQKTRQHKKSKAWMHEHVTDPYVQKAKAEGWRSRAVFKLKEIDEKDRLLRPGMTVVDLGAAPGSWCQYAARRIQPGGRLIALDLLEMTSMAGVEFIQGDFREEPVLRQLESALGGRPVDLVLSDMAPNISGIAASDSARVMHLAELTLEFARDHLKPGGDMLVKVFQGAGFNELRQAVMASFAGLQVRKPAASRDRSAETYLLARAKRA